MAFFAWRFSPLQVVSTFATYTTFVRYLVYFLPTSFSPLHHSTRSHDPRLLFTSSNLLLFLTTFFGAVLHITAEPPPLRGLNYLDGFSTRGGAHIGAASGSFCDDLSSHDFGLGISYTLLFFA